MTRDEYLKELNKAFGDFKFFADDHHYEYKGKRVGISVTKLIEQYTNEFDADTIARKVAIRDNRDVQDVLDEWKYKNEFAKAKGTTCHSHVQHLWNGDDDYEWVDFNDDHNYNMAVLKIEQQAHNFHDDYVGKLEHVADEYIIGSAEYDLASAIDHIFIDKATGGLILVDYKTNKELSGYNKKTYKKPMKAPLQHLNDDALTHYRIQLSIYKYIVEKYTNLVFEDMFIVYFSENIDNYEIIKIPYLKDEVETILEWRKYL